MFVSSSRNTAGANNRAKAQFTENTMGCGVISAAALIPLVKEGRLLRVLESIEAGPPQSVRELAQGVNLSPTHLQRLFKQTMGVHISDLLAENRLTHAARLLSTTEIEVSEIAHRAGYRHHSSFVRAFQRRFRQAPKDYRQRPAS
jgi:transcriptional regulator GlxA family with amidase domain